MIQRYGPPGLLVAAIVWATASGGGTSARDLTVVLGTLLVASTAAGNRARPFAMPAGLLVSLLALLGWLVAAGPLRSGMSLTSVRVPALVLIVVLTVTTVRLFDHHQREWTLHGIVAVGSLHATIALGQALAQLATTGWPSPPRADSFLGNANALGVLLIASAALTAREIEVRRHRLFLVAIVLQGVAVLATGSRLALVLGTGLLLIWALSRRRTWRTTAAGALWLLAAGVIGLSRSVGTPPERLQLWLSALKEIAQRPWIGRGTTPTEFDIGPSQALATTHAHNEVLQLAVEYGLIGLALAGVLLVLAYRSAPRRVTCDKWILAAALSLLASGLTDFGLRITAVAVTTAALGTMAALAPRPALPQDAADAQAAAGPGRRGRPRV
ncbi:MAG: O-antigen ligase family protein [Geodermatophilaceae bacterium]|nr:O-antigen ligase family protein [Geodermatophilaceae bacterium]MDQ3455834.1 O-antigen ligase family protein [Actinomycetota bacterium]